MTKPLALTLGDPAGVGPEIVAKAWQALKEHGPAFVAVGDADLLAAQGVPVERVASLAEGAAAFAQSLPVLDLPLSAAVEPGRPSSAHAPAIVRWIETAVALALKGEASGVVTAPIAKAPLYEAGFKFPGHTEFLADLTASAPMDGERGPVMMLASGDLRTVLVTIHEPYARAPALLTVERIVHTALVTAQALRRDFGVERPRLAVAGLNPHAGESGQIGREEVEIIAPAVAALKARGIDAVGPRPADTLFHPEARKTYDAAVCMYHDQALIPVKMLDFWGGVNVTLGLPIVRVSPDHGTGYDVAGQGLARPDSLIAALRTAAAIAARRALSLEDLPPLREALAEHGLFANKGFGQHFLLDLNITRKIARLAGPLDDCVTLEIGPGPGGLTRALLEAGARVVAVEKDPRFGPLLAQLQDAAAGRLTVVEADALKVDERALADSVQPGAPVRIVANLPYNVGTPLLIKWLTGPLVPQSMSLMFQKEVAQRIVAPVGSDAYGRLAVIAQAVARCEIVMDLPARAFTPPPKVASAVARLDPLPQRPSDAELKALQAVTHEAFGQRRKMLKSSLKALGGAALCEAAGIDPEVRAETIDVAGFLALARALKT